MIIAQKYSLRPDKLVLYSEVTHTNKTYETYQNYENSISNKETVKCKSDNNNKVIKKFHNFNISKNAYSNLKNKINWLYYLSKSRYVTTYSGKKIYTYKMSFITLTLPTIQKHTTSYITKHLFNQFLTEIRTRTNMQNYVWRLEFQKNRNVHYHIVTDSYLDYFFILKVWNRILDNYGYIKDYTNKFKSMSLKDYCNLHSNYDNYNFEILKKRYIKGIKSKWKNPNTVDVKSVNNKQSIANYISKYFGKNDDSKNVCNSLDNENNSFSLRLWFCSRSLSKLKSVTDYLENCNYSIFDVISKCSKYKIIYHQYVRIVYYTLDQANNIFKSLINKLLLDYAKSMRYSPAT